MREAVANSDSAGEVLKLTDVDKRYPGVHALKQVSFDVCRGEVHAIVGENGAGKSTLVGIASGAVLADSGTVEINGATSEHPSSEWSRRQGLAIVYQEPALLPDLTVAENMRLGVPEQHRPSASGQKAWAAEQLRPWRDAARIDPGAYVRDLRPDERFVVEIARALAGKPAVLILDEPTEHLLPEGVAVLFAGIKREIERGGAVVYISHRIREVMQVADRISVLRDGARRAELSAAGVGESEIVDLIVGRRLDARFPAKPDPATFGDTVLEVGGLSGTRFADVSLSARAGEIVGLAGIDGHGQRETMRALAGLAPSSGEVRVEGRKARLRSPATASASGFAYLPNDRHVEGILPELDVRENLSIRALSRFARAGIVNRTAERRAAWEAIEEYEIKTPSLETEVEHLSGGNQQKTMLSRIMMSESPVVLTDEPTQGVDVGARADIYHTLRDAAGQGACVLVVSSDASELEGLCDRVLVFSGGRVVDELSGEALSERNITEAALGASGKHRRDEDRKAAWWNPLLRLAQKDIAPSLILALVIVALGVLAASHSDAYLTTRNFSLVLPLFGTLAFIAIGQQIVMFLGGIDLSMGPLAGLILVVASFRLSSDADIVTGLLTLLAVALAVGALNWTLIVWFKISPLIATLVTYIGLQGIGLLIREIPGGQFAPGLTEAVTAKVDFIPVAVIVAVAVAVAMEVLLYRSLIGIKLRAVGSKARTAETVGVRSKRIMLLAYLGSAFFALLGALLLMPQVGSGNATAGNTYTLTSVAAVVLGGASIFGGRGSFIGALLGAALIIQINTVVQFLGLTPYWQEYLLGGLTILAAAFYSKARATTTRVVASEHGAAGT